jgi:ABC-type bacteriocin/lantibiotic exporter with double-glycine peptidase domain
LLDFEYKLINKEMRFKSFKRDWTETWPSTAGYIVSLVFVILAAVGVITGDQSTAALPAFTSLFGGIATSITAIITLIGIFFKKG